jgi:hypothetical protein
MRDCSRLRCRRRCSNYCNNCIKKSVRSYLLATAFCRLVFTLRKWMDWLRSTMIRRSSFGTLWPSWNKLSEANSTKRTLTTSPIKWRKMRTPRFISTKVKKWSQSKKWAQEIYIRTILHWQTQLNSDQFRFLLSRNRQHIRIIFLFEIILKHI